MNVRLLEATENPKELICRGARNDYMSEFNADLSFEETMASVEGETIKEKKRTLIAHLLQHGHYGPFEHPSATFAVEGMSRACMAQLTHYRHVSFDVQSMSDDWHSGVNVEVLDLTLNDQPLLPRFQSTLSVQSPIASGQSQNP